MCNAIVWSTETRERLHNPHPPTIKSALPGITAYLNNRVTLENARAIAAYESSQTTRLYDPTGDKITLDEVERPTDELIETIAPTKSTCALVYVLCTKPS